MTKLLGFLVLLCFFTAACGPLPATTTALEPVVDRLSADPLAPTADWVAGTNAAGWDFHCHLVGNAVSSPVSLGLAFSLSRAGASEETGAVLDQIFGLPEVDLHAAANAVDLMLATASVEPTTLEVANRLFPDDEFSPLPEFLENAGAHYGAAVQPIDLDDGASAAETINGWTSDTTPRSGSHHRHRTGSSKPGAGSGEHGVPEGRLGRAVPPRVDRRRLVHHRRRPRGDGAVHARPRTGPSSLRPTRRRRRGRTPIPGRPVGHVADRAPRPQEDSQRSRNRSTHRT